MEGITKGIIKRPVFVLIHGVEGVGKTTFGASAQNPILLGAEDGSAHIDVARFDKVETYVDIKNNIARLLNEKHDYKTLVLDSLDWTEQLMHKQICKDQKTDAIEDTFGSFGKWVGGVGRVWMDLINDFRQLRDTKKMNIVVVAHSSIKPFNDPTQPLPYDRYVVKINEKHAALWREAVDCVLFANFEVVTKTNSKTDKKAKAYGEDHRLLFTQRRPSFDAKNRFNLPHEMALDWTAFYDACNMTNVDAEKMIADVMTEIAQLEKRMPKDAIPKMQIAILNAKKDINQLSKIRNHARVLAGE